MPFERYLRADVPAVTDRSDYTYYYQDNSLVCDDADCRQADPYHDHSPEHLHHDHHAVQLQIPHFMLNGPPMLAPGGGAEVLPAGLLDTNPDLFASSWFANSGFAPPFHSTLIPSQPAPGSSHPNSARTASHHAISPNASQHLPQILPPLFTASVDPQQHALPEPPPSLHVTPNYIPNIASPPPCASTSTSYAFPNPLALDHAPSANVTPPSALGLPVYSVSGFDVLSILSRVVYRPNPTIQLGPVDLSCSFVIVDVRRYDSPIVYASPTFCHLTGYGEQEVLGRNCRFLQSPTGHVAKGEPRRFASPEAVSYMRKSLSSSKECQTTLINYRKGGKAFINLVTVIPLRGGVHNTPEEADEITYHIGFQVDLTEQPIRILDKLRDGSYYSLNNSSWGTNNLSRISAASHGLGQLANAQNMTSMASKGQRHGQMQMMSIAVSRELRNLFADPTFTDSAPISTGTNVSGLIGAPAEQGINATTSLTMLLTPPSSSGSVIRMSTAGNMMAESIPVSLSPSLSLLLLEFLPDFILVLSLKGAFLYVAPSVRLVLGYEPQELVGRSISDICHPADLVPLMRELKEGSVSGLTTTDVGSSAGATPNIIPKSVDLLFRALPKVSKEADEKFVEQGNFHPSQQSSTSASQSRPSSGASCSNDPSDGIGPPYVWLECRGRLHVEPGKGRKAIILSGRARWMPLVRWSSVDGAGGVGNVRCHTEHACVDSRRTAGSSLSEAVGASSTVPLEFWALLSNQGTFLVASASVRDILGWGTSEVIGRSIWAMIRDNRSGMRERVEAELAESDAPEARNMADPPPTIVTTSLAHKDLHVIPVRLVFYRTPQSQKYAPPSISRIGVTSRPLIHPVNNPLCPIVCQATVLSNAEYQSSNNIDASLGRGSGHALSTLQDQIRDQTTIRTNPNEPDPYVYSPSASLFEELETTRGSSWQYELQQLKFSNQRLLEEVRALESACEDSGTETSSSCAIGPGRVATLPTSQHCASSSSTTEISILQQARLPQTQLRHKPLMHSTLSTYMPSLRLPNSLHEQDPPSSVWSSLAGATGQGPNPLKRSWGHEDGPTT